MKFKINTEILNTRSCNSNILKSKTKHSKTRFRSWRESIKWFEKIEKLLRTSYRSVSSLRSMKKFYSRHSLLHMRKFWMIISRSEKRSSALNHSLQSIKSWTQFLWSINLKWWLNLMHSNQTSKRRNNLNLRTNNLQIHTKFLVKPKLCSWVNHSWKSTNRRNDFFQERRP